MVSSPTRPSAAVAHKVAVPCQRECQHLGDVGVVFDDQHARHSNVIHARHDLWYHGVTAHRTRAHTPTDEANLTPRRSRGSPRRRDVSTRLRGMR
jgi:hypothetical protein